MHFRNILLAVGVFCVVAGLLLSVVWISERSAPPPEPVKFVSSKKAVLTAARNIPEGTLLQREDITWREVDSGEALAGDLVRGEAAETDLLGAIARRNLAAGEPLRAADLVRPSERQFLSAVLRPGTRAISIAVDAPTSVSGLIRPDDYADVILIQKFDDKVTTDPARKTVGETVLRNVRVIGVDRSLISPAPPAQRGGASADGAAQLPKTVTLELTERQAEVLLVAAQLGTFQLSVRPLETGKAAQIEGRRMATPVWASEVSPALDEISQPLKQVSVRVYTGMPRSEGYLCSKSTCISSGVTTAASEYQSGRY